MTEEALKRIDKIAHAIANAGFDPVAQLYGYYLTRRTDYITRQDDARSLILLVELQDLQEYLETRIPHGQ